MKKSELRKIIREEIQKLNEQTIFDIESVKNDIKLLNKGIKAPFVVAKISMLGGKERVVIIIIISMNKKEDWPNNIFENSKYIKLNFSNTGELGLITQSKFDKKFRKTKVKSINDAINKINKFLGS